MSDTANHTYNPYHSHIKADAMTEWLSRKDLGDLSFVPGIGEVTKKNIIEYTTKKGLVCNTAYSLIGYYLTMKTNDISMKDHANYFFLFLQQCGVHGSHIHEICKAVFEKANLMMDGLYAEQEWERVEKTKLDSSAQSAQPEQVTKAYKTA